MCKNGHVKIFAKSFSELLKRFILEKERLSIIGDEAYLFYSANMSVINGTDLGEVLKILSGMEFEPNLFSYRVLEDLAHTLSIYDFKKIRSFIINYRPS